MESLPSTISAHWERILEFVSSHSPLSIIPSTPPEPTQVADTFEAFSSFVSRHEHLVRLGLGLLTAGFSAYVVLDLVRKMDENMGGDKDGKKGGETLTIPGTGGNPPRSITLTSYESTIYRSSKVDSGGSGGSNPFARVGGLEEDVRYLREEVVLPLQSPSLTSHSALLQSPSGVLLYGPPGTGKTLLATCLASSVSATFLSLSPSRLQSKWVGESVKLAAAAFSLAKKLAPTVLFVDEIDGLLPSRSKGAELSSHTTEFITNFLSCWEGLGGGGAGGGGGGGSGVGGGKSAPWVLVVAASNRPTAIDEAALRRLPCRRFIPYPNAVSRAAIFKALLAGERVCKGLDLGPAAAATEGYTGSDLREVVKAAVTLPVLEARKKVSGGGETAVRVRDLTLSDLLTAVSSRRPTREIARGDSRGVD